MSFTGLLLVGALLVSRATGVAGVPANAASFNPAISADGRYVVFASSATNLVTPADNDGLTDIYVRDRQAGATTLVSQSAGVNSNGIAERPAISADGRFISFATTANNLNRSHDRHEGSVEDIYVYDSTTRSGSPPSTATAAVGDRSYYSALSSDGRYVAFDSFATNLHPADPTPTRSTTSTCATCKPARRRWSAGGRPGRRQGQRLLGRPQISGDGRMVVFESTANNIAPEDTDGRRTTSSCATWRTTPRPSVAPAPTGERRLRAPSISADGRFVVFASGSANLDPADADVSPSVYVRDPHAGTTRLLSGASAPAPTARRCPPTAASSRSSRRSTTLLADASRARTSSSTTWWR